MQFKLWIESNLPGWKEKNDFYQGRLMSLFVFDNGVKILGRRIGKNLLIFWISTEQQKQGLGTAALLALKTEFNDIEAREVAEHAVGFWQKMKDRGIVSNFSQQK